MPSRRTAPAWAPATALLTVLLTVVLGVLGSLVGGLALPAPAHAAHPVRTGAARHARTAQTTEHDPISVTIDHLTPSTLRPNPTKGTVQVTGTITNADDDTWLDLNVHAFIGDRPLTTETELTEASLSDPAESSGIHRITQYGDFETIPALAPGQSTTYSLTIPRADLQASDDGPPITAPGAYWFGIQVLGTNTVGRDDVADGRARTFLPLVDTSAHPKASERAALVVPLRQRVLRQPDGRLAATDNWLKRLSPEGRLTRLLDFASDHPVSWLVDPAVIDAVQQLADGNPQRSIDPTDGSNTSGQTSASPSAARRAAADDATTELTDLAKAWLARLVQELKRSDVYDLPYGDLDLAASARYDPGLYPLARQRSTAALAAYGIHATPIDAPVDGYLQTGALSSGDPSTRLLLSDQAISGPVPAVASIDGRSVVTTSSLVAGGGPPPGDGLGLVAVRQELLAQSALRLGTGDPVVAVMPADWSPGDNGTEFFDGLARKWLHTGGLADAVGPSITQGLEEVAPSRLRYPDAESRAELSDATFSAVNALRTSGRILQNVLPHNDAVANTVLDDALTTASYTARGEANQGGAAADRSREAIDGMLRDITVDAPPAVTLSSDRGRFNATVVNGLDQDIALKVVTVADNGVTLSAPHNLEVPAHGRSPVLLNAKATSNGVHTVTLRLTDPQGTPLGSEASFPIRTAQVSRIIWLFIVCGVGLLFFAILARLVRRLRGGDGGGGDVGSDTGEITPMEDM